MARHIFSVFPQAQPLPHPRAIHKWFRKKGFTAAQFDKGRLSISLEEISHQLEQHVGYDTFFKPAAGGAMLVFEVCPKEDRIEVEAYSPMMLFGLVKREYTFKANAGWLTRYRKEGYELMLEFQAFLGPANINEAKSFG